MRGDGKRGDWAAAEGESGAGTDLSVCLSVCLPFLSPLPPSGPTCPHVTEARLVHTPWIACLSGLRFLYASG